MNKNTSKSSNRLKNLNPLFHKKTKAEDNASVHHSLLLQAQKSGKLVLTSKNLSSIPDEVLSLGDGIIDENSVVLDSGNTNKWWEIEALTLLDLSSNSISSIPGAINRLDTLKTLLLQNNILSSLPPELSHLFKLVKLDVSHNKLSDLPIELTALKELKWLSLCGNQIPLVPDCVYDLVMLQNLDLSKNRISKLVTGMGFLVRLTHLNLSHNDIGALPPDISNCKALLDLNLSFNNITSEGLPPLGDLHAVQIINLTNNKLSHLPSLNGCSGLKEIHLGNNKIKILIPDDQEREITIDELSTLSHLQVIVLRDNQIEKIPREMSCMQNLIRIDLTNNNLTELPATLGLLPHLQNLLVDGNSLRNIRRDVITGGTQRLLKYLKQTLPLNEDDKALVGNLPCQSDDMLPDRFSMRSSKALNLASKNLCNIPEAVFEEALQIPCAIVDISKNRISDVPLSLWKLYETMTDLNLSHNKLTALPDLIKDCTKLEYIRLENNQLTSLPRGLGECQRLREINIACNRFQEIPDCLYSISGLEILIARDNKISALDVNGLKKIKYLSTLDIANNSINTVPPELGMLSQIRNLGLDGNPFRVPRPAILSKGTDAIMGWLRDRIPT